MDLADRIPRLRIGSRSYGACIQNYDFSAFVIERVRPTVGLHTVADSDGIGLGSAATEIFNGKGRHRTSLEIIAATQYRCPER